MATTDGGPAFPVPMVADPNGGILNSNAFGLEGMSLRDWFAGQALQGILASETGGDGLLWAGGADESFEAVNAKQAYEWADAMLAERAKEE